MKIRKQGTFTAIAAIFVMFVVLTACKGKNANSQNDVVITKIDEKVEVKKESKYTDFKYELNKTGDGVVITGYQEDAAGGDVVIPSMIEGYPVVAFIGEDNPGFKENSYIEMGKDLNWKTSTATEDRNAGRRPKITSITFPDSIIEIRLKYDYASFPLFYKNSSLKSITFPKNLKQIPYGFVKACENLSTIKWPETLEIIGTGEGSGVFVNTGITELVIPEGVKIIGKSAFFGISDYGFSGNKKLTSITIPDSVIEIGAGAFSSCPELTMVKMPSHTIKYPDLNASQNDNNAFAYNPKLTSIAVRKAIQDTGYTGKF